MPYTSIDTINNAKDFMEIIHKITDIVDKAATQLPDGDYLETMNGLMDVKQIFDMMKEQIINLRKNQIVVDTQRRASRVVKPRKNWSEERKLKSDDYIQCPKCDRVVSKTFYEKSFWGGNHQSTEVCRKIQISRKCVKLKKSLNSSWSKLMLITDNSLVRQMTKHPRLQNHFICDDRWRLIPTNKMIYEPITENLYYISNTPKRNNYTLSIKNLANIIETQLSLINQQN